MRKNINEVLTTKRQKYLTFTSVILLLIAIGLFSYAFVDINYVGLNTNKISNCSIDLSFKDSNPIRLTSSFPMDYATAKDYDPYTFYIKSNDNNCDKLFYKITMESICNTCSTSTCSLGSDTKTCNCTDEYQIAENLINYELKNVSTGKIITGEGINNLNEKVTLLANQTDTYEMRIWISDAATAEDLYVDLDSSNKKNYCGKLNVEVVASDSNLDESGANTPELASNMIPVYYDETNDVWKKADVLNLNENYKWYDYDNKMWANAVTVTENNRKTYLNASLGTEIPLDDINTMWVWIPRFSVTDSLSNYNGGTKQNPGAFNITFVNRTFAAHSGFTLGNDELSGFWIGKFENSSNTTCQSADLSSLGSGCNLSSIRPKILPNENSWTGANVSTFYLNIKNMTENNNQYGFLLNEVDTHMLKNEEWAAVSYLTQSIYGRCTSSTNCTEVGINLYDITGYGSFSNSITSGEADTYETSLGKNASTTGNIYGVYDMSGGTYEYVMEVYSSLISVDDNFSYQFWSGYDTDTNSGFNGCLGELCSSYKTDGVSIPNDGYFNNLNSSNSYYSKYYSLFTNHDGSAALKSYDAIFETAGWYNDATGTNQNAPWFIRGGYYSDAAAAGIFSYSGRSGASYTDVGSRSSLTLK